MEYDVILTDAESIPEAFEAGNSLIRLNSVSQNELEVLNRIVSREEKITLIALPFQSDGAAEEP